MSEWQKATEVCATVMPFRYHQSHLRDSSTPSKHTTRASTSGARPTHQGSSTSSPVRLILSSNLCVPDDHHNNGWWKIISLIPTTAVWEIYVPYEFANQKLLIEAEAALKEAEDKFDELEEEARKKKPNAPVPKIIKLVAKPVPKAYRRRNEEDDDQDTDAKSNAPDDDDAEEEEEADEGEFGFADRQLIRHFPALTETSAIAEASVKVKDCEVDVKQLTRLVRRDNEFNEGEQRRQSGLEVLFGDVIQLRHAQTQLFLRVSQTHSAKLNHTNVLLELSPTNDRGSMFKITPRNKVRSEGEPVLEGSQVLFAVQIGIEQYISRAGVFDRSNGKLYCIHFLTEVYINNSRLTDACWGFRGLSLAPCFLLDTTHIFPRQSNFISCWSDCMN